MRVLNFSDRTDYGTIPGREGFQVWERIKGVQKELEPRRILPKLLYFKNYPFSYPYKTNIIFKLNICFVHVTIFSFVTVSKSIPVQLKFKAKYAITIGITTEFILQSIFHTQDDWGDVSVAVVVVNGVVHRPHQEAVDGYVEGVVSLQSASPLCTTHTTLQLVNFNISHKRRVKLCYWTGRVKFNIYRARARFPTLSIKTHNTQE